MPTKAELEALLERVEAAIHCNKSLFWDVAKTLEVPLSNPWGSDATALSELIEGRAWESAAICIYRYTAPNLVLGVSWFTDGTVGASLWWPKEGVFIGDKRSAKRNADMAGAAILIALLKALIAEEREDD